MLSQKTISRSPGTDDIFFVRMVLTLIFTDFLLLMLLFGEEKGCQDVQRADVCVSSAFLGVLMHLLRWEAAVLPQQTKSSTPPILKQVWSCSSNRSP